MLSLGTLYLLTIIAILLQIPAIAGNSTFVEDEIRWTILSTKGKGVVQTASDGLLETDGLSYLGCLRPEYVLIKQETRKRMVVRIIQERKNEKQERERERLEKEREHCSYSH